LRADDEAQLTKDQKIHRHRADWLGAILFLLAAGYYVQIHILPAVQAISTSGSGLGLLRQFGGPYTGNDFLHIYLGPRLLWGGFNPYDPQTLLQAGHDLIGRGPLPYVYLPFTSLVMGWIAQLDYGTALLAWTIFSHILVLAAIPVTLLALKMPLSWRNLVFALIILGTSFPLMRSLSAGQLNAPLMFGYALFYLLFKRAHPSLTGALAAALMLFKLSPGILLIYLLWTRAWPEVKWMLAWTCIFMLVAIGRFGLEVHLDFLPLLRDMGYGRSTWGQFGHAFYSDPANQSLNSLFHHLFANTAQTTAPLKNLGPSAANALTWIASLGLLGIVLTVTRSDAAARTRNALDYSLFIMLSLLLPSLMWDHYLIQAFFPILAIYGALQLDRAWWLKCLFLVGLIMVNMPFNFFSESWRQGMGIFMMSFKLYGLLLIFFVNAALAMRKEQWRVDPADENP